VPVPDPTTIPETAPSKRAHGDAINFLRRFGPLALLAAALVAVWASGLTHDLSLHMLRTRREALEAAVHAHPLAALGAYVGTYTLVVALSLPAALVMTLTGGLLFGPWVGGLAAAISCTLGSAVIFLVCRTAIGDALRRRAGSTVARIEAGVRRDAFSYVITLRLIPVMPFWLANLALGFVDIPLGVFVAASFIGILPVSVVYAGLGANLNLLFARHQRPDPHLILRPEVLLPLAGLALLALAPILARQFRRSGAKPALEEKN
jgi:uncharacterized membrane protein YdjX (TVP38/TMEM64 family)